jgi:drug/metabolite transporter (DMT)-like permease
LVIVGLGILQIALPYLLFAQALKHLTAQEGGLISLSEPVMVPIWVLLVWGAPIAWHTIAGGTLIIVSLVVRYAVRPAA